MNRMKLGCCNSRALNRAVQCCRRPGSGDQKAVGCRANFQGASGLLGEFAADFQKTLSAKRISAIPDLGSLGA